MADPQSPSDLQLRLQFVERLLQATRMERMVYVVTSSIAAAALLITGIILVVHKGGDFQTITSFFGSSGLFTASSGRLLKVWSDALNVVK